MKLQDTYFTIRKISYPNSNTHHGKFRIILHDHHQVYSHQPKGNAVCPDTCTIQMLKECAQLMAHEKFLISYLKQYKPLCALSPAHDSMIMAEIFLTPEEKEGSGNIVSMKATVFEPNRPENIFLKFSAELSPVK